MPSSGWGKQPSIQKPCEPNRGRQKKAKRYSAPPAQRAAQEPLPQCVDGERRKRCDLDGERDHLPIEPDAGDAGELDVAEPDALASAQPAVERAQQQESERQRRAPDDGKREPFKRDIPTCDAGVDQAQAQPDRNQYIGNNEVVTYRVRWTRGDDSSYEAWSEAQTPNGWATMFKLVLRRTDQ